MRKRYNRIGCLVDKLVLACVQSRVLILWCSLVVLTVLVVLIVSSVLRVLTVLNILNLIKRLNLIKIKCSNGFSVPRRFNHEFSVSRSFSLLLFTKTMPSASVQPELSPGVQHKVIKNIQNQSNQPRTKHSIKRNYPEKRFTTVFVVASVRFKVRRIRCFYRAFWATTQFVAFGAQHVFTSFLKIGSLIVAEGRPDPE